MLYLEREMTELAIIEEGRTSASEDERFVTYTQEFLDPILEIFSDATSDQVKMFMVQAREWAKEKIQLEDLSGTDQLTGLQNRHGFYRWVDLRLRQQQRALNGGKGKLQAGILLVDLDLFKGVNDTHGHTVGDQVLSIVGQLVKTSIRSTDIAARWGGEEMCVFLDGANLDASAIVAEKIRLAVSSSVHKLLPELQHPQTVSIGAFQWPDTSPEQLVSDTTRLVLIKQVVHNADLAQYQAKAAGRNGIAAMLPDGRIQIATVHAAINGQPATVTYSNP